MQHQPPRLLLCCVCQEKNTTFRYEVVCRQDSNSIALLEVKPDRSGDSSNSNSSPLQHQLTLQTDSWDSSENEYYNFPPRHPRHGHLKWPVWTPANSIGTELRLAITYPDYPIHIPTLTLRRITTALAARQGRGSITSDLRQYLNTRFPKGGLDHDLQNTIRDNLYLRTVPVTTRVPRDEERNGVDYTFLSKEEFLALEKSGDLLESGVYDGNHYGTPKPSADSAARGEVIPGQHPSSEGKRRRNRSNVEAMAAKHMEQEQEHGVSPDSGSSSGKSVSEQNADSGHPDSPDDDGLGPLPPNWEKALTDKGEPYFIDHNTGTSHWLDPRLSRVQKKRPEDCEDNELPFGWERIDDPHYGTYYIDHVNRRTQYENPVLVAKAANQSADDRPFFTREPSELRGERLQAQLVKSTRGLGFTIVGGDDSEEEFLQIKSVVPNGPAWLDGRLKTGDVLVYVNGTCVLGFTHHDMVTMFQGIAPGQLVRLDVCRGYPLPFDPDDPNTEIVTTVAVTSPDQGLWANQLERQRSTSVDADHTANSMPDLWRSQGGHYNPHQRPGSADLLMDTGNNGGLLNGHLSDHHLVDGSGVEDLLTIPIVKGGMGFGFTIADSAFGQKVKKILDRPRCKNLNEGDILVEINQINVRHMSHSEVVQVLKDCTRGQEAAIKIQRGNSSTGSALANNISGGVGGSPTKNKFKNKLGKDDSGIGGSNGGGGGGMRPKSGFLFRSKTPTAELFATQEKEVVPNRPKTPIVDTRNMAQKQWNTGGGPANDISSSSLGGGLQPSPFTRNDMSRASLGVGGRSASGGGMDPHNRSIDQLSDHLGRSAMLRSHSPGRELDPHHQQHLHPAYNNYNSSYNNNGYNNLHNGGYNNIPSGYDPGYGYTGGYEGGGQQYRAATITPGLGYPSPSNGYGGPRTGSLPRGRKESTSFEQSEPVPSNIRWPGRREGDVVEITVTLLRHDSGFGFRIVGGTEEGSQVSIGHIVPGGAADMDGRLYSGDEIVAVDGQSVLGASHHVVVGMMGSAAQRGQVQLTVRRRSYQEGYREGYPYDVTVSRLENEGFGFVIISSVSRAGSTIGRIIPGSPAERCGRLQVGDRILAVNHVEINSLHHGDIVNLIKESGYSVTLTVGPPLDDTSSTASTSQRSSSSSMVTAQARPLAAPAAATSDSVNSSQSSLAVQSRYADAREGAVVGYLPPAGLGDGSYYTRRRPGLHSDYYQQEDQEVGAHLLAEEELLLEGGGTIGSSSEQQQQQYFAVQLERGQRGFGFSIRGGREFHSMPLFVLRMAVDGPAALDGRLRVGDQLIEINGQSTRNLTHAEAIELIKNGGRTVRLLVRRGQPPPHNLLDQAGLSPTSPTPLPGPTPRPVSSLSQPSRHHLPLNGGPLPNGGGGGGNGPVSHSSPRYPPNNNGPTGYYQQQQQQQPYWGYHQQSVE